MQGRFRDPGNAQDCTRGRNLREIIGENFVQFAVLIYVFKIYLDVNQMIHREAHGFERASYILKRLSELIRKVRGSAPVLAARSLTRDIYIVPRLDCERTECMMRSLHRLRRDRSQLSLHSRRKREQRRDQQNHESHAPFPLRAEARIARSRCPTIISSPGWIVMETNSI